MPRHDGRRKGKKSKTEKVEVFSSVETSSTEGDLADRVNSAESDKRTNSGSGKGDYTESPVFPKPRNSLLTSVDWNVWLSIIGATFLIGGIIFWAAKLDTEVEVVQSTVDDIDSTTKTLSIDNARTSVTLRNVEENITGLRGDVSALRDNLDDIGTVRGRVDNLDASVFELQSNINDMRSDLTELEIQAGRAN